ncbi:MAG: TM2 domain-containing protein [Mogibacterium sp.]|nr:TM2 domain-containing protein [Mogibacterium sp.]
MVWEVDTEPADGYEAEDAYPGEIYENASGNSADGYDDRTDNTWYGPANEEYEEVSYSRKCNKHIFTWVFSLVCGMYGVDRFVRGQVGLGILKLLTFGGMGFWYMADLGVALYKSYMAPDAMTQEDLHFDSFGRYV